MPFIYNYTQLKCELAVDLFSIYDIEQGIKWPFEFDRWPYVRVAFCPDPAVQGSEGTAAHFREELCKPARRSIRCVERAASGEWSSRQ